MNPTKGRSSTTKNCDIMFSRHDYFENYNFPGISGSNYLQKRKPLPATADD